MSEEKKQVELEYVDVKYDEVGHVIYTGDFLKQRARNYCFTWNNYTIEDIASIKEAWPKLPTFRGCVFEQEVAPSSGTPHLQGFVCFDNIRSGKQMKEINAKISWQVMLGSIEANRHYCMKDGEGVTVIGTFPMSAKEKGIRGGSKGVKGKDAEGTWGALVVDIKAGVSKRDLMEKYAALVGPCPHGFDRMYNEFAPGQSYSILERFGSYLPWQKELMDLVELGPDERSVHWIYSIDGGVGKSAMYKHLIYNNKLQPMRNATTRDLSCAWKCADVVFDFARDRGDEKINYSFMENVKDGISFSSKYESQAKLSDPNVHRFVICFANEHPDVKALTLGRWRIFAIEDNELVPKDVSLFTGGS